MDEAIVSAARDQAGPECEIMVDAGGSDAYWPHGYKWALQTATMLHKYDVTWFEEALRPDDIEGYAKLTEHAPIPISSCEVRLPRRPVNGSQRTLLGLHPQLYLSRWLPLVVAQCWRCRCSRGVSNSTNGLNDEQSITFNQTSQSVAVSPKNTRLLCTRTYHIKCADLSRTQYRQTAVTSSKCLSVHSKEPAL
jgi:hypothetical protein